MISEGITKKYSTLGTPEGIPNIIIISLENIHTINGFTDNRTKIYITCRG